MRQKKIKEEEIRGRTRKEDGRERSRKEGGMTIED
jgi:hypothetical protein